MKFEEHVHIIPLGYEIDRAVKPFDKLPVNRVYLLVTPPSQDYPEEVKKQEHFVSEVKRKLEKKSIQVTVIEVDLFDIKQVMKNVAGLILKEKSQGNDIYVNMSAAGRLTSVGATLAAMAHNAKVYYVQADRYSKSEKETEKHGLSICEAPEGIVLENFQIKLPDEMGKIVLTNLRRREKPMGTDEILTVLVSQGMEIFQDEKTISAPNEKRRVQQKNRINLNKVVLDKLEKSGYITREKLGRFNKIALTESGKYMAHIIGSD